MKVGKTASIKTLTAAVIACAAVLYSCKKDTESPLNSTDSQNVNSESVSASTSNEAADLGNAVITNVTNVQLASGRVAGGITGLGDLDRRLDKATITITVSPNSTKANPVGTITIDYGTGVTTDGVTRKGKIIVAYIGKRFQKYATRTITFDGFTRNSVKVEGTYHVTVTDSTGANNGADVVVNFSHETNLTLTFLSDNTKVTRTASFTVVFDFVLAHPLQSTITHKEGSIASGTDRKDNQYVMAITHDVVYRADCFASGFFLPVSGTKSYTVTAPGSSTATASYIVDYGTTTCDNTITVQIGTKKVTVTVSGDGN